MLLYTALSVTLGNSLWSLSGSRIAFLIDALLASLTVVLALIDMQTQHLALEYLILGLHLMFWAIGGWVAARALLSPGAVDLNRIAGSVCVPDRRFCLGLFVHVPEPGAPGSTADSRLNNRIVPKMTPWGGESLHRTGTSEFSMRLWMTFTS